MRMEPADLYADYSDPATTVGKPAGIPFLEDRPAFADFFEELAAASGEIPRRLGHAAPQPRSRRAAARDGNRKKPQDPKVELILYTSPESEKSQRAIRTVQDVLKRYDASQVRFTTCDLSQRPQDGDVDSIVFTPTLVKQGPGPRTSIIGNLERQDVLCDLLDASGVDRRWDD